MTAFVLLFPFPEEGPEVVKLWPLFWLPRETARERDHLFPFMTWGRDGGPLKLTDGGVVDYSVVLADVLDAVNGHKLRLLALYFDQHYAEEITQRVADLGDGAGRPGLGCERVAFPQTLMAFTGPAKEFERRVSAGLVRHPKNPVMTWQVGHCEVWADRNRNVRPVKSAPHSGKSVDGVVGAVMTFAAVVKPAEEHTISPHIVTV
jgi:phage terminase large subunit-like protein